MTTPTYDVVPVDLSEDEQLSAVRLFVRTKMRQESQATFDSVLASGENASAALWHAVINDIVIDALEHLVANTKAGVPVTVWSRLNQDGEYEFNHLEDGHSDSDVPADPFNRKWSKAKWTKEHARLSTDTPPQLLRTL